MPRKEQNIKALDLAKRIRNIIIEKNGTDVVLLDLREHSMITDYCLIASGTSTPHLKAMLTDVVRQLKQDKVQPHRKSGVPECGWIVIDYFDVVVHIFTHETRNYYSIEDLWEQAPTVE